MVQRLKGLAPLDHSWQWWVLGAEKSVFSNEGVMLMLWTQQCRWMRENVFCHDDFVLHERWYTWICGIHCWNSCWPSASFVLSLWSSALRWPSLVQGSAVWAPRMAVEVWVLLDIRMAGDSGSAFQPVGVGGDIPAPIWYAAWWIRCKAEDSCCRILCAPKNAKHLLWLLSIIIIIHLVYGLIRWVLTGASAWHAANLGRQGPVAFRSPYVLADHAVWVRAPPGCRG